MEHRGDWETQEVICPRCCADQRDEPIDIKPLTEEQINSRKMWREVSDLCLIYKNWANAHRKHMERIGQADYSSLEDFGVDVLMHSALYIGRLQQTPGYCSEMDDLLKATIYECTEKIMQCCLEYEELQRLGGTWDDNEQEIKEHWLKKIRFLGQAITASTTSGTKQIESKGENASCKSR